MVEEVVIMLVRFVIRPSAYIDVTRVATPVVTAPMPRMIAPLRFDGGKLC